MAGTKQTRENIVFGTQGWEARINNNLQKIFDAPAPLVSHLSTAALESATPAATNKEGLALVSDGNGGVSLYVSNGTSWVALGGNIGPAAQLKANWFIPMTGVTDTEFDLWGGQKTIATALALDYLTDFSGQNRHVTLNVTAALTGGDVTVSGTSVDPITGVPTASDSEVITIDSGAGKYRTTKKWHMVTSVTVLGSGVTGIVYDIGLLHEYHFGYRDVKIVGYKIETRVSASNSDLGMVIEKVKSLGTHKYEIVTLEDIGFDSSASGGDLIDGVRSGADDRSTTYTVAMLDSNDVWTHAQQDFDDYFVADEHHVDVSGGAEGLLIRFEGRPSGGLTAIEHASLSLYYELLPV